MKKLLLVINTMGRSGAERSLISLLKALRDDVCKGSIEISLLSIIPRGEFFDEVPSYVKILNVSYSNRSVLNRRGTWYCAGLTLKALFSRFSFIKAFPSLMKGIFMRLKRGHFSWKHVFWEILAYYSPELTEKYDLAVAFIEGASSYYVSKRVKADKKAMFLHIDYAESGYLPAPDLPYFQDYDKIFCVSKAVKTRFCEVFPSLAHKSDVFYNILDKETIEKARFSAPGFEDGFNGIRFLTVGRLYYQKGYDIAIEAASVLAGECKHRIRWYVIGGGHLERYLRALIKKNGLEDIFILLGEKKNPFPYIDQCDIYIHATRYEGCSVALSEAVYLNKPIIATDTAGVREQLSPESSIIINLDKNEIVKAAKILAEDSDMRKSFTEKLIAGKDMPNNLYKLKDLLNLED